MLTRHSPSRGRGSPDIWGFYEEDTGSIQYVCADPATRKAALIDIVLNFNPAEARVSTESADEILAHVEQQGLTVEWILDTHPHADHMMAAAYLKEKLGAPMAIGTKVVEIAELWRGLYNLPDAFDPERDFDLLWDDGASFRIGELDVRVMLSPGHTLGSVTYVVADAAFVHDTLMYPDMGSSRADFPGGSSKVLWQSIQEILALPQETRLFVGHDYGAKGRDDIRWEATVAEHRSRNVHVMDGTAESDFTRIRDERDKTLELPGRMLHALQVNLRGGRLPPPESDGNRYLKIPVNRF
ncbi:MAG: MBL fold metallo-hydrolase [Aurantimonas endophytica]|uniref:Glyoxylase-like metal-dependent hydrolase (Beta-lactamase superfamily II) n=1 Tax=Aurantimonas endophytica TaxID=1522175 RepID=A0A7W6HBS9_9HYPH|nr:MBL fold metallo-hydrolase [Aurantimonas endophytica]MBB4002212.1 glyoxylase-like metal-dependent hydrolase (beta-lactamase superfamily II) [Aurantimonas endophytica]MCO6402159.1 MBL fold metallo-hydrolase [Aurantimonas endophytica]